MPSAELADQALNIAVQGDSARVTVTQAAAQSVVTVGDSNTVNTRFEGVAKQLDQLKIELSDSVVLSPDEKRDAAADIETLKTQLTKSEPDADISNRIWQTIEKTSKAAGLAHTAMSIGKTLGELL